MTTSNSTSETTTIDGVKTVTFESFLEFIEFFDRNYRNSNGVIWRGHAEESWILEPTIVRKVRQNNKHVPPESNSIVNPLFVSGPGSRGFASVAETLRNMNEEAASLNLNQLWSYAQHNGMYTPFLDWTRSAYVAMFFAFAEYKLNPVHTPSPNIVVWGLSTGALSSNMMGVIEQDADPIFKYEFLKGDHHLNQRLFAQQGVFTRVWPPMDIEQLVKRRRKGNHDNLPWLVKACLPKKIVYETIIHLSRMNVNFRTLFPDQNGACLQANLNMLMPDLEGRGGPMVGFQSND